MDITDVRPGDTVVYTKWFRGTLRIRRFQVKEFSLHNGGTYLVAWGYPINAQGNAYSTYSKYGKRQCEHILAHRFISIERD